MVPETTRNKVAIASRVTGPGLRLEAEVFAVNTSLKCLVLTGDNLGPEGDETIARGLARKPV